MPPAFRVRPGKERVGRRCYKGSQKTGRLCGQWLSLPPVPRRLCWQVARPLSSHRGRGGHTLAVALGDARGCAWKGGRSLSEREREVSNKCQAPASLRPADGGAQCHRRGGELPGQDGRPGRCEQPRAWLTPTAATPAWDRVPSLPVM